MKKKIIVTGAAGFIGSNFCQWLLDNTNHDVIGVDDLSGGYVSNMPPLSKRFLFFEESVTDASSVNSIFDIIKPSYCFHLACYAAEARSNYIRTFIHTNNTVGTTNIINACVNYNCKLIFTSSVAVYSGTPPYCEETIPNPIDEYGLSKLTSERSIMIAGLQQGLDWCIIRPRNVYGEHQSLWDNSRNVMGIWMNQILNEQPMTIFGDGGNKRTFTYIGDILKPLYAATQISYQTVNLGASFAFTIQQANEVLQDVTGYENVSYLEARHEVAEASCDIQKSVELLGFRDKTGLYKGLKFMWAWAKKQPFRNMQVSPKLEITKNTHSSIK